MTEVAAAHHPAAVAMILAVALTAVTEIAKDAAASAAVVRRASPKQPAPP